MWCLVYPACHSLHFQQSLNYLQGIVLEMETDGMLYSQPGRTVSGLTHLTHLSPHAPYLDL